MLCVGRLKPVTCGRLSRRELLRAGGLGVLGLSLGDLLKMQASGAGSPPRAKSIILLWLWGGPSHVDTFDMKPKAPIEYRGPYAPIATSVPGIEICELLPETSRRAHQYSIIRSLCHESNDHGVAGTIGLTGSSTGAKSLSGQTIPGQLLPSHGSVVSRVQGFRAETPRFVTLGGFLHQGHLAINGEGGGSVGTVHDPFRLDYDPVQGVRIPQLQLAEGVTPNGLTARRQLLDEFDKLSGRIERSRTFEQFDEFYRRAFSLLTSPQSRQMFDLSEESEALRRRYGRFRFGQCCLLARRLIEAGSRFVQVNWSSHVEPIEDTGDGGWDMHDRYFQQYQDRHAWMFDQSFSALLDDLKDRGLLDETIVVAAGEFGRTPKINGKAGRDHWNDCYSAIVAGGGLRAGHVIGASDKHGERPVSNKCTPADLFATVLDQIGIGTTQLTTAGITPLGRTIEELL
ncbi:MAG: DUF1501 domain-containing protein [Planctomycetaceae bacterium]